MAPWSVLVTGASRGFGRAAATALSAALPAGSVLTLTARSPQLLHDVAAECVAANPSIQTRVVAADLGDVAGLEAAAAALFGDLASDDDDGPARYVFVNNAGSLGPLAPASALGATAADWPATRQAIDLNVTSAVLLAARFAARAARRPSAEHVLVNVSSLAALQPFETWGVYCAGKAARDAFHATLAKEQPGVAVLNYAPGPMDTAMTGEICAAERLDDGLREYFTEARRGGTLVDADASAAKMAGMAAGDLAAWKSGAHVDFFDDAVAPQ